MYLRSTNITLDRSSKAISQHLVLTRPLIQTLDAIGQAASSRTSDAAIAIVGPYGTGKSTSVLSAAEYLCGELPKKISSKLKLHGIQPLKNLFKPDQIIPIVGDRTSLKESIQQCLSDLVETKSGIAEGIDEFLKDDPVHRLVLIIDELGKFLEYSMDHPEHGDLFVLQQLAELANRSDGRFILVTIRHQALQTYFRRIQRQQLNEWKKIQGRFLEVVHMSSLEETLPILREGINELGLKKIPTGERLRSKVDELLDLRREIKDEVLTSCYPIHPLTAVILIAVFKKIAQHERSLFSFLVTNERHGLNYFLVRSKEGVTYSLSNLFDYLNHNLYHIIAESDLASTWLKINYSLALLKTKAIAENSQESAEQVIKTIGILECFGEGVDLHPTKETIEASLIVELPSDETTVPDGLIDWLEKESILNFRRLFHTYHLWRGSDINVDVLIETEVERLRTGFDYSRFFKETFSGYPISARKYYIETGTFRFANWQFHSLDDSISEEKSKSDGTIFCLILPRVSLKKAVESCAGLSLEGNTALVALKLNHKDRENILRHAAIDYLLQYHQPLAKDEVARQELQKQRGYYGNIIEQLFGAESNQQHRLYYYSDGRFKPVRWEEIGRNLSDKFLKHYHSTPRIHNELINQEKPSPSAIVGLKSVLFRMLETSNERNMGIEGTGPDYSIYLNVLKETSIHSEKKGKWRLQDPGDSDPNLLATWIHLKEQLVATRRTRKKITFKDLEDSLREPPYGLKTGLIKVLVFASVFKHLPNLSIYEQGTFTSQIYRDTLERMLKRPEKFTLQYIETSGVYQALFKEIYQLIAQETKDYVTLMDAVKPLIQFANRLPYYTKKTKSLSSRSRVMVDVLLQATEPETLLYEDLPAVFDLPSFSEKPSDEDLETFIDLIDIAHKEIRAALDRLIDDCGTQFQKIWGAPSNDLPGLREFLRGRFSENVIGLITDDKMNALARRIMDEAIENDYDWFRSLISLLADKPVDKWLDRDVQYFIAELRLRALQLEELERFAESGGVEVPSFVIEREALEQEIEALLLKGNHSREEKVLALMRVYNRLMREVKLED